MQVDVEIIVASLPFKHARMLSVVAVSKKVVKTRRVILFLKILDVILKCGTEYSGFNSVDLQKWSLKLPAGKYKIKGKVNLLSNASKARFKRRILHAPNRIAKLTACKMRCLNQLNASSVEYTTEVRQLV